MRKPELDFKLKGISARVTKNKTKYLLVEKEQKKLKTFDSSYFIGNDYLEENFFNIQANIQQIF